MTRLFAFKTNTKLKQSSVIKILFGKKYGCGSCGATFKDREELLIHAEKTHDRKTTYLCITCDESFSSEPSFRLHMARDHKI